MPRSLQRTWVALVVATLAVLVVALLTGRDFVRDVVASCPGRLEVQEIDASTSSLGPLDVVPLESPQFQVVLDGAHLGLPRNSPIRGYGHPTSYENVKVIWREPAGEMGSTCGSAPIMLAGEAASDLRLYRVHGTNRYVVKGRLLRRDGARTEDEIRLVFVIEPGSAHRLQTDRLAGRQHLPLAVALVALGAVVVAYLRSRHAMAYALRMHGWTEASLTPSGLIESDDGARLGTLEQTTERRIPIGPVLVAPEASLTGSLYRDMPIIAAEHIASGSHARWATGTMVRLRDARALAVISTAAALLAFGARLVA